MSISLSMSRTTILAALCCAIPVAARAAPPKSATAHAQTLLKDDHSWNGVAYEHYPTTQPQLTMLKLTIPPHTALPWHHHPVPNAGYVLEGQLTIQDRESGKEKTFHQGEAFAESVNDIHRGVSGDTRTVLLLTYSGTPGTPTSVPEDQKNPEY
ncbi:cupin domain-containing protein [Brytella acorum]|uniref:Cupin domain-containing protein n=1 Tax=Brytella acorum TaxID=2959299 RepID=A0AA35V3Y0_9PROT|nr:cupin domain-containing protein [Brytella acorum]MDF3625618.1 cupin domain-containing protein [Brytella acorum]CAI9119483.1 cupin domain-containing protein [Brytella acorum]